MERIEKCAPHRGNRYLAVGASYEASSILVNPRSTAAEHLLMDARLPES